MESNQYIQAIAGIREILFDFVRDFQVYGYGANLIIQMNIVIILNFLI